MKKLLCSSLAAWALAAFLPGAASAFTLEIPCCIGVNPKDTAACATWNANKQECLVKANAAGVKICKWNPECGRNKCCTRPGTTLPCPIPNANPDTCKAAQCLWSANPECSPSKSGPCCKAKPGSAADCSLPLMNLGHPQDANNPLGHTFGKARCEGMNGGASCAWDQTNPECRILPPNPCPPPMFTINQGNDKFCCQKNTPNLFCCQKLGSTAQP